MPETFFQIEMLPARHGDCLWIEYGEKRNVSRVLIDGGPVSTYEFLQKRIAAMPQGDKSFELIVLTHVDADHVEGLVRLFADKQLPFNVDKVWFNGWRQIKKAHRLLGAMQGEFLSALLASRVPRAWNADSPPWVVPHDGPLPENSLPGGMKLTLLSPSPKKLQRMEKAWKDAMSKEGIAPGNLEKAWKRLSETTKFLPKKGLLGAGPEIDTLLKQQFKVDSAAANGSTIAFLAEYGRKSALLLGDAHPDVVADSVKRLCIARGLKKLSVDVLKVAHHGSKNNTSEVLLGLIDSPAYLISTNGDVFRHPDKECLARILKFGKPKTLYFNYRSDFTKPWLTAAAEKKYNYKSIVRDDQDLSLKVPL